MRITTIKKKKRVRRNKKKYRLQNWKDYNKGLKKRGDITLWINPDTLKQWQYKGKRGHGGHYIYSDHAILTCRTIGMVFHQPLRQQQGFVDSLLTLFKVNLTAPNYSVVSRRSSGLRTQLNTLKSDLDKARQSKSGKIVMIVDSTGIKIYGISAIYRVIPIVG